MKIRIQALQPANRRALVLSITASLALVGVLQASTVTETFDSAESATTNGWTGVGNTTNNNNYGWSNTNDAGDAAGEAGGIFARSAGIRYYADTNGGTLTRNNTLTMSGKFVLLNDNFDGNFRIGFFNTADVPNNFVGIEFSEPTPTVADPFRGFAAVGGTGGASTDTIPLTPDTPLTFNLTFTPAIAADGSGTLTGTVGETAVNVAVAAGSGSFNAFGLVSGGFSNQNQKTAGCYFDDLTYTAATPTTYTITYDGNGNTSGTAPAPQVATENQPTTLATNSGDLAKDGLTFNGWNTAADGTGTNYAAGASYTGNGNITLYARWAQTFTITYDGNGNTGGTAPAPQNVLEGQPTALATNSGSLVKDGFVFSGWNTTAVGTGTQYAAGANYTATGDVTLYAKWVENIATWINTTTTANQSWATAANWSPAVVPNGIGAVANITSNIAANQTITLGGSNRTVGTLNIGDTTDGSHRWTITGNTLIFDATSGSAQLNVLAGAGAQTTFINSIVRLDDDLVITINQANAGVGFVSNAINQNGGDRTLTLTSTVASPGSSQFGTVNGFTKLVVSGNAIFNNTRVTDDRAMGRVLSSFTADAITLDGGILRAGRDAAGLQTHTVSTNRGITLGAGGGTLNGSDSERVWVVNSVISGSGALNITGPGPTTLNAVNTYAGDTNVTGTLIVTGGNAIPDTGKLVINTGGKVNPSGTTETVATLFFGAEQQIAGTWGATGSGASNINDTYFTGTGVVSVATGPAPANTYSTWATTNGAGPNLNDDHDNDGVDNGVEFFLVGPTGNSTGFTALPGVVTTAGVRSITWTKAADYPGVYGTDFQVETSETLAAGSWTTETVGGNITITGNDVKYTFPAGPTKKFARLVVTGP
jgi:uncharacterized repeat protein (TIGR02543 family)